MVTREFIKKNTEHLLSLFGKKCINQYNVYVWEDEFGNGLRMTYENEELDNLCQEALFKGEKYFYAKKEIGDITEPEYVYKMERELQSNTNSPSESKYPYTTKKVLNYHYVASEPEYVYVLTRPLTPEEYEFLASMLNLN